MACAVCGLSMPRRPCWRLWRAHALADLCQNAIETWGESHGIARIGQWLSAGSAMG
jgi:hypothetical protein